MPRPANTVIAGMLIVSPLLRRADFWRFQASALKTPQVVSDHPSGCLSYEPSAVELHGTIIRETFPGPPNYASIRGGDKPEEYWFVVLSDPICVDQDKAEPDLNPAQKDIHKIQLVFRSADIYKTQKDLVGKRVVAKGMLFGANTGHHHTPVLLTVSTLSKAG